MTRERRERWTPYAVALGVTLAILVRDWPNWSSPTEVLIFFALTMVVLVLVSLVYERRLLPRRVSAGLLALAGVGLIMLGIAEREYLIGLFGCGVLIGGLMLWVRQDERR